MRFPRSMRDRRWPGACVGGRSVKLPLVEQTGRALRLCNDRPACCCPDFNLSLFGDLQCVVHLDAQISHRRLKLGMSEQQLDGPQILRAPINQSRLGSPHRVRAVARRVKSKFLDPSFKNARVLPGTEMRRVVNATRKQKVVGPQPRLLYPLLHCVASRLRDLGLHRSLGFVLHHDRTRCNLITVADVAHLETDEVATAKLAVNSRVKKMRAPAHGFPFASEPAKPRCP